MSQSITLFAQSKRCAYFIQSPITSSKLRGTFAQPKPLSETHTWQCHFQDRKLDLTFHFCPNIVCNLIARRGAFDFRSGEQTSLELRIYELAALKLRSVLFHQNLRKLIHFVDQIISLRFQLLRIVGQVWVLLDYFVHVSQLFQELRLDRIHLCELIFEMRFRRLPLHRFVPKIALLVAWEHQGNVFDSCLDMDSAIPLIYLAHRQVQLTNLPLPKGFAVFQNALVQNEEIPVRDEAYLALQHPFHFNKLMDVNHFMAKCKPLKEEKEILELLSDLEKSVYQEVQEEVNSKLLPELRITATPNLETTQPSFLHVTPALDREFMHSHMIYQDRVATTNSVDRAPFQQFNHMEIVDFPIYDQNYLDVNANSKHFHPPLPPVIRKGLHDIPQQYTDQSNVQNYMVSRTTHYDFEQPEQKLLYPRKLIPDARSCYPLPERIQKSERQFKMSSLINKMGGLPDTLGPMNQSIQENEKLKFLNTPEHSFLRLAQSEQRIPPPKEPEPVPPVPDPFTRNPQYRLFGGEMQSKLGEAPLSCLPVQKEGDPIALLNQSQRRKEQPEFQQPERHQAATLGSNFLQQARQQRELKAQRLK